MLGRCLGTSARTSPIKIPWFSFWFLFWTVYESIKDKGNTIKYLFLGFLQQQASPVYTGTPFSSILHSRRGQKRRHYTPRPLLNPLRRGAGLYSSLSPLHRRADKTLSGEEAEECDVIRYVEHQAPEGVRKKTRE